MKSTFKIMFVIRKDRVNAAGLDAHIDRGLALFRYFGFLAKENHAESSPSRGHSRTCSSSAEARMNFNFVESLSFRTAVNSLLVIRLQHRIVAGQKADN